MFLIYINIYICNNYEARGGGLGLRATTIV